MAWFQWCGSGKFCSKNQRWMGVSSTGPVTAPCSDSTADATAATVASPATVGWSKSCLGEMRSPACRARAISWMLEDRVAAQLEEIIVDAHLIEAQHSGPDLRQQRFGSGRGGGDGGAKPRASAAGDRQRGAVELAVRRQRQRIQHDKDRRDHILGQVIVEEGAKLRVRGIAGSGAFGRSSQV